MGLNSVSSLPPTQVGRLVLGEFCSWMRSMRVLVERSPPGAKLGEAPGTAQRDQLLVNRGH